MTFIKRYEHRQYVLYIYPDQEYTVFMERDAGGDLLVCAGNTVAPDDLVVEILAEGVKTWDLDDDNTCSNAVSSATYMYQQ